MSAIEAALECQSVGGHLTEIHHAELKVRRQKRNESVLKPAARNERHVHVTFKYIPPEMHRNPKLLRLFYRLSC